jgi:hypothetical protein
VGANLGTGASTDGAHDWLYPVTQGGSAAYFGRDTGCSGDLAEFRRVVTASRIVHGEGPLWSGYRSLRVGDALWLYGGTEIGIMGRATVRKLERNPEPRVRFALDRPTSRTLVLDPMPASMARRSLPGPIDRPIPLAEHPELRERLQWWIEELETDDRARLEPLGLRTLRHALRHDPSPLRSPGFSAAVRMLRARQLAIGVPPASSGVTLVGCDDQALVVASQVRTPTGATPRQVLQSVGLFAWYGRSLPWTGSGGSAPSVFLVFESAPSAALVTCLEDLGTFVCWAEGDGLELAPTTRRRLEPAVDRRPPSATPGVEPRSQPRRRPTVALDDEPVPRGSAPAPGARGQWLAPVTGPAPDDDSFGTDDDPARGAAGRGNGAHRPPVEPRAPTPLRDAGPACALDPVGGAAAPAPIVPREGYTESLHEALQRGAETAFRRHHATVETAHVMVALMDAPGEKLARMLDLVHTTPARVGAVFEDHIARLPAARNGPVTFSSDLEGTLRSARLEAAQLGEPSVDAQLFVVGALRANGVAAHELARCGVHLAQARAALVRRGRPRWSPRRSAQPFGATPLQSRR